MAKTKAVIRKARVDPVRVALERLAEAQRETQVELRQLVEAQRRTEERLDALTQRLDALTQRVDALAQRLAQLVDIVGVLTGEVKTLKDRVGDLRGDRLERHYREHASAYFDDVLRRLRVLSSNDLVALIDDAADRGQISRDERRDLLLADVVARGRRSDTGQEAYMVADVSATIDDADVARAVRRALVLARAIGAEAIAAVGGEKIGPEAERTARALSVWHVTNGHVDAPGE